MMAHDILGNTKFRTKERKYFQNKLFIKTKTKLCFPVPVSQLSWERWKRRGYLPAGEKTGMLALPFHTSQRRQSSQTVFLMALLVVEPSKRTPGNDSSTHIFSAWLWYFPKYFPLITGCFRYLVRIHALVHLFSYQYSSDTEQPKLFLCWKFI